MRTHSVLVADLFGKAPGNTIIPPNAQTVSAKGSLYPPLLQQIKRGRIAVPPPFRGKRRMKRHKRACARFQEPPCTKRGDDYRATPRKKSLKSYKKTRFACNYIISWGILLMNADMTHRG